MESVQNPFLDIITEIIGTHETVMTHEKIHFGDQYAYSIPDPQSLDLLASFSPIIEIGAGRGYWGSLLKQMGVDIVCTDINPPAATFTEVTKAHGSVAGEFPKRTLFICWPYRTQPMVRSAAEAFFDAGGRTVVYIADGLHASDKDGEAYLAEYFPLVETFSKYSYSGIRDQIHVHRRVQ